MFPNELVELHQAREKEIHDTWVIGCGLEILVSKVKIRDADGETIQQDNDPTGIPISYVDYKELDPKQYMDEDKRYMIVVNTEFVDSTISFENMLREDRGEADVSTMNDIYAYVSGDMLTDRSIIKLEKYPSVMYEVEEVMKKRPLSSVRRYKLVRT